MDVIPFIFDDEDDMDALDLILYGLPRQIYERKNYFDFFDEAAFRRRFRLSRPAVLNVLGLIDHQLEYPYDINNCVSPMNQLLVTLRYFSTGGHLQAVADFAGMHLSTVSRIIVRVSEAIADKYNQFIKLPNDELSVRKTQLDFFNIASFPKVIGAIDCTHIKIQSPGGNDAEVFRNRKQYFSFNTQMICNAHLRVLNVVARWPGSAHDATIFTHSIMHHEFENNLHPNCLLLGDSGYPLKNYLMTPLLNPRNQAEQLYNESQIRSRNTIERCFGVLKRRFPVLAYGCRLKIDTVLTIIIAATILHNIALDMGENEPPPTPEELDEHVLNHLIENGQIPINLDVPDENLRARPAGLHRTLLINEYFAHL